jgi:uncharacterized DUF497 family protein
MRAIPIYKFSPEKNLKLIEERGISFEEVIAAIENDQIIDILEHPNSEKYGDQKIYVIYLKEYVYLIPFVTDADDNVFLKTIIPSRKAKKKYS